MSCNYISDYTNIPHLLRAHSGIYCIWNQKDTSLQAKRPLYPKGETMEPFICAGKMVGKPKMPNCSQKQSDISL